MRLTYVALLVLCIWASCGQLGSLASSNDDVAGPIVKLSDLQAKPENVTEAEDDKESKPETIAQFLDAALQKEFTKETSEDAKGGSNFNATVQQEEAKLETVVRIAGKATAAQQATAAELDGSDGGAGDGAGGASGAGDGGVAAGGAAGNSTAPADEVEGSTLGGVEVEPDVDRIIDSQDNEFVLSKPSESVASLTLDQQLIRDISVLLVSAALFGTLFEAVRQPVINGYLIGGAVVGPGGLNWINELVQVESLAQLGVQLLLFGLGLELSFSKLRAVWGVAVMGGTLQIVLLSMVGGLVAAAGGAPVAQGIFVGALLSMSSTAVVIKCLEVMRSTSSAYGQITTGTLLLQDCMVGVMFALLPLFNGGPSTADASQLVAGQDIAEAKGRAVLMVLASVMRLCLAVVAAIMVAKTLMSPVLRLLQRQASRELVQLALVAVCVGISSFSQVMGLSSELGAFVAGVMVNVALGPGGATHGSVAASSGGDGVGAGGGVAAVMMNAMAPIAGIVPLSGAGSGGAAAGGGAGGGGGLLATHGSVGAGLESVLKAKGSDSEAEWGLDREALMLVEVEREWEREREREKEREKERHRSRETLGSHAAYYSIESARNVLVALFMASIGLIMSPRFLADHLGVLTVGVGLVVLVKGALVAAVVRGFSVGLRTSLAVGLSMAHVGEFAFVLLSHAVQSGLLPLQVYMLLLGVTALSLLTTPFIVLLAMHWVLPKDGGGGGLGGVGGGGSVAGGLGALSQGLQGRGSR